MYLAKWHSSPVAVKVLTHADNLREAEQFRHVECPDALFNRSKQLNYAYYCVQCLKWMPECLFGGVLYRDELRKGAFSQNTPHLFQACKGLSLRVSLRTNAHKDWFGRAPCMHSYPSDNCPEHGGGRGEPASRTATQQCRSLHGRVLGAGMSSTSFIILLLLRWYWSACPLFMPH